MKRVLALSILIFVITLREAHGWLPPLLAHRWEWWWQEWWFNALVTLAALSIGVILARRGRRY